MPSRRPLTTDPETEMRCQSGRLKTACEVASVTQEDLRPLSCHSMWVKPRLVRACRASVKLPAAWRIGMPKWSRLRGIRRRGSSRRFAHLCLSSPRARRRPPTSPSRASAIDVGTSENAMTLSLVPVTFAHSHPPSRQSDLRWLEGQSELWPPRPSGFSEAGHGDSEQPNPTWRREKRPEEFKAGRLQFLPRPYRVRS